MSTFVSDEGVWRPANEKVGLVNKSDKVIINNGKEVQPGDPFVYEGPDRAAVEELEKEDEKTLGKDFRTDPEYLQATRNMGFNNPDEHLSQIGYDKEKAKSKFREKAKTTMAHEPPEKKEEVLAMGGGKDTSGEGQDIVGGFGEQRVRSVNEVRKRGRPRKSK